MMAFPEASMTLGTNLVILEIYEEDAPTPQS
jgi:hypothetical protein